MCGNWRAVWGAWLAVASDCYHHHYTIIIIVIIMLIMIISGSEQARALWHARPAVVSDYYHDHYNAHNRFGAGSFGMPGRLL